MPKTKVILNPKAGRGYASAIAPAIERSLTALHVAYELAYSHYAGEAIALAGQAIEDGFETIVAVGGDGTSHEVINGMMAHSQGMPTAVLGCIPAGSGNDFAVMNGVPTDIEAACRLIAAGQTRTVDLGRLTLDGSLTRYFDNTVGIGFDALVTFETRRHKHLRGMALYLPAVLKTIFVTLRIPRVELTVDGVTTESRPLMIVACNGPREGGGFMLAPGARWDDGQLDLVITEELSRLGMLALVPRFMNGTHISHPKVSVRPARQIKVRSGDPLYIHVDGEILADLSHEVEIEVVPQCLRVLTGAKDAGEAS